MEVSLELVRQERPGGGRSAFRAREAAQEERDRLSTRRRYDWKEIALSIYGEASTGQDGMRQGAS
jgi:hypothetical protein